jgi:hypothetical protein
MEARRAWSTAFWSAARALVIFFFCKAKNYQHMFCSKLVYIKSCVTYLGLLSVLEESFLGLLLLGFLLGEVVGSRNLLNGSGINTLEVDLGASGDHIARVDPSERDTVDLEGTGNQENTLGQVLEEHNPLTAEAASEEDQDGTRLEALADLGRADGLANLYITKLSEFLLSCFQ